MPNSSQKNPTHCRATTSRGKPCQAHPLTGNSYCFTHSPDHVQDRAAARRRGGENSHLAINPAPFPDTDVTSARGLRTFVAALIQDAWTLPPSVDRIRALTNLVTLQTEIIPLASSEQRKEDYRKRFSPDEEYLADDDTPDGDNLALALLQKAIASVMDEPISDDDETAAPSTQKEVGYRPSLGHKQQNNPNPGPNLAGAYPQNAGNLPKTDYG